MAASWELGCRLHGPSEPTCRLKTQREAGRASPPCSVPQNLIVVRCVTYYCAMRSALKSQVPCHLAALLVWCKRAGASVEDPLFGSQHCFPVRIKSCYEKRCDASRTLPLIYARAASQTQTQARTANNLTKLACDHLAGHPKQVDPSTVCTLRPRCISPTSDAVDLTAQPR